MPDFYLPDNLLWVFTILAELDAGFAAYSPKLIGFALYIYAYFILVKTLQPFSRPFILVDSHKETG